MATLLPLLRFKPTDGNNQPIPGGKLFSYQGGTSTPRATYSDSAGLVPNPNPVILDANGEAEIWLRPGSYKFTLTDENDVELFTIDDVRPADGGGGGLSDADYNFSGYSARFAEAFESTGLEDTLLKILEITYTAPQITLSASGSGTVREKGDAVTASTLTAAITKRSDPIAEVRFYQDVSTLLDTQTSGGGIPSGGNSTYNWTGSEDDNFSFVAQVDDDGSTGGPTTVTSNTVTFTFVYPYYFGSGAAALAAASVAALTKDIRVSTSSLLKSFTPNGSQVLYFAYPASYGALTSILDENGFNTFPSWTLRTENITGLDGNPVSYRIYEYNNTPVAGTYPFTFIR